MHMVLEVKLHVCPVLKCLLLLSSPHVWWSAARPQWHHHLPKLPCPVRQQRQLHMGHYGNGYRQGTVICYAEHYTMLHNVEVKRC